MLTLIAPRTDPLSGSPKPPLGFTLRPCQRSDTDALGRLYFAAYEPGAACDTLDEAVADIAASFNGDYGALWPAASPVIYRGNDLVAALLTVRRAPWHDTPPCPFIIELFTAPAFRRQGLARILVAHCLAAAHRAGEPAVALRVAEENVPAFALYASLGFTPWSISPDYVYRPGNDGA